VDTDCERRHHFYGLGLFRPLEKLVGPCDLTVGAKRFFIFRHTEHASPLYPQELALTSPTSGGRSVCTVRSRTKATELVS
jgi:hypothetical protein